MREPEYARLEQWIDEGDWSIDVGANQGRYTARLSQLTGPSGRVLAFEPVPETFQILASIISRLPFSNVTAVNAAVSDSTGEVRITVPTDGGGVQNYYRSHITKQSEGLRAFSVTLDSFISSQNPIKLVKIDAEGHEFEVVRGMQSLLETFSPVLIIEENSAALRPYLEALGYSRSKVDGSPNAIYTIQ